MKKTKKPSERQSAILIGWFASFLAVNKYIREKR